MGEWADWCRMYNNDGYDDYTKSERERSALERYAEMDTKMSLELNYWAKIERIKQLYETTRDFETIYHSVWDIIHE